MLNIHHFRHNVSKTRIKKIFAARNAIHLINLAREKKSLATPAIVFHSFNQATNFMASIFLDEDLFEW